MSRQLPQNGDFHDFSLGSLVMVSEICNIMQLAHDKPHYLAEIQVFCFHFSYNFPIFGETQLVKIC